METDSDEKIIIIKDTSSALEKPKKEKKPRSEAQKAAAKNMLAKLAEKRKQQAEDEERDMKAATELDKQEKLKLQYEIAKMKRSKKLPPIPAYVTTAQLELMERRIMAALPREVYRDVPQEIVVKEKLVPVDRINVVEKEVVRERPVIQQKQISGNQLLDSIFFK